MTLKKHLPNPILFLIRTILHMCDRYGRTYYSQEGEDFLLARILGTDKPGFYVDVGAHHPSRFSNTYYFYKRGWRGINIDAWPGSMQLFQLTRPRDVNLEIAVADRAGFVEFHVFTEPLLNSANKELADRRRSILGEAQTAGNVFQVPSDTLESILNKHLPEGVTIDFISVDVEGLDLTVLQSNDWVRFRPKYVLVEILGESVASLRNTETSKLLESLEYEPISKLMHTVVYRDKRLGKMEYV